MKKITLNEFIKKSNLIHDYKYNYSKSIYINTDTKLIIICNIHGDFQKTPYHHTRRKQGCPDCSFIKKSNKLMMNKMEFVRKANMVHNYKYSYDCSNYIGYHKNVDILCKLHGIFSQRPANHISLSHGCPICSIDKSGANITIAKLKANHQLAQQKAKLYLVSFENENESFYKIGITMDNIKKRFAGISQYQIKIMNIKETTLLQAMIEEKEVLKFFYKFKYVPKIRFNGWTECFNKEFYNKMFNIQDNNIV